VLLEIDLKGSEVVSLWVYISMLLWAVSHPPILFRAMSKISHPELEVSSCPPCVHHLINNMLFHLGSPDVWRGSIDLLLHFILCYRV
jgi:hypothetical protein